MVVVVVVVEAVVFRCGGCSNSCTCTTRFDKLDVLPRSADRMAVSNAHPRVYAVMCVWLIVFVS